MYRTAYQRGMLTVFFSGGSKPLEIWDCVSKDGYIKRFLDQEIKTMVMEIRGTNISTTYIICPKGNQVLGIHMPFLVMIVKNLNKYFSFEVTVLDDTGTRRRFRVSNFQSTTQILPLCTVMPIGLSDGWNQIQFNLAEFTRRAYKKEFQEVQKLKINANIRLRRIYFTERLMSEEELPPAYKLFFPLQSKSSGKKVTEQPANAQAIKVTSKTELQPPMPAENLETVEVIKEASLTKPHAEGSVVLEKKPSVVKTGSAEKVASIDKVTDADKQASAAKVGSVTKVPSETVTEGASAEGAADVVEVPAGENPPEEAGTEDAPAPQEGEVEKGPEELTHPTDGDTTEPTTAAESGAEDAPENT